MRHHAKFCADRSKHCQVVAVFSIFQDGGRTSSWICYTRAWDHLRKVVGSLYRRAKFGMNRQAVLKICKVRCYASLA